jgi:N-acetylglutamate synthase-like GNAT family acetyltransferase
MGKGTADALYAAILAEAKALNLPRLTALASRYFQGFLARRGWHPAPGFQHEHRDPDQSGPNPYNRPMVLIL